MGAEEQGEGAFMGVKRNEAKDTEQGERCLLRGPITVRMFKYLGAL